MTYVPEQIQLRLLEHTVNKSDIWLWIHAKLLCSHQYIEIYFFKPVSMGMAQIGVLFLTLTSSYRHKKIFFLSDKLNKERRVRNWKGIVFEYMFLFLKGKAIMVQ